MHLSFYTDAVFINCFMNLAFIRTIGKKPRFIFYADVVGMDIDGKIEARGTEMFYR